MHEELILDLTSEESMHKAVSVLKSKGSSIGLRNVLGRLKLYYGDNFVYKIESKEGEGTRITLLIKYDGGDLYDERSDHG
jgi:two-component system sensor histidine kinase YesM